MNLLAIDTSDSVLSVAILRTVSHSDEIFEKQTEAGVRHSELVMDYIDNLMKEASLKPEYLDMVICMGGPGSFTGLRIGYSIAKGLALSLSIPFMPVPTLECIAYPYIKSEKNLILPVIKARKNAWFYSFYRGANRLISDADGDVFQIIREVENYADINSQKIIVTGPAAASFYEALPQEHKNNFIPDEEIHNYAKLLIAIAKTKKLSDNDINALLFSGPEYIRNTVV